MTTGSRGAVRVFVVASLLTAAMPLLPSAAEAASSVEVPTAIEAWYRTSPVAQEADAVCGSPVGCPISPLPPAPPYPEQTLHVGATSGRAEAIAYVAFATSNLPSDTELTGGTAVLPVAATEDGTVAADSAELRACLLTERFEAASGDAPDDAPEPDCDTSVPAEYVGDDDVPRFEIDLTGFVSAWEAPGAIAGLALLPAPGATGTWHVAFSRRERGTDGAAPPITATLDHRQPVADAVGSRLAVDEDGSSTGAASPSTASPPGSGVTSAPSTASSIPDVAAPAPEGPATPELRPEVASPPAPAPGQPLAATPVPAGYPYPVVWLLPLALAIGGLVLVRSLTGDVEVLEDDAPRDLIGRLWLAFFPDRHPAPGTSAHQAGERRGASGVRRGR